jgi:hypothetical protein
LVQTLVVQAQSADQPNKVKPLRVPSLNIMDGPTFSNQGASRLRVSNAERGDNVDCRSFDQCPSGVANKIVGSYNL